MTHPDIQLEPYRKLASCLHGDNRPSKCPHPNAALRGQDVDVLAYLIGRLYPTMNIRN